MPKFVYLTIDDAPSEHFLDKVNFLEERQIPAIWFAQANLMEKRSDMMIEAIQRGLIIGNHSYSHPHFSELTVEQCLAEIRSTDAVLNELHERANVPRQHRFFRFPYGDKGDLRHGDNEIPFSAEGKQRHDAIQGYLRNLGYTQPDFEDVNYSWYVPYRQDVDWFWSYDSLDWSAHSDHPIHGIDSPEKALARLDEDNPDAWLGLNNDDSADIILIHDHGVESHQLFKDIVMRIEEKGIQFRAIG